MIQIIMRNKSLRMYRMNQILIQVVQTININHRIEEEDEIINMIINRNNNLFFYNFIITYIKYVYK